MTRDDRSQGEVIMAPEPEQGTAVGRYRTWDELRPGDAIAHPYAPNPDDLSQTAWEWSILAAYGIEESTGDFVASYSAGPVHEERCPAGTGSFKHNLTAAMFSRTPVEQLEALEVQKG